MFKTKNNDFLKKLKLKFNKAEKMKHLSILYKII